MIRLPVSQLEGPALAWAVAIAEGRAPILSPPTYGLPWRVAVVEAGRLVAWRPERDWLQLGQVIARHGARIGLEVRTAESSASYMQNCIRVGYTARCVMVATCRAVVAAVLGETVEVPAELAPALVVA